MESRLWTYWDKLPKNMSSRKTLWLSKLADIFLPFYREEAPKSSPTNIGMILQSLFQNKSDIEGNSPAPRSPAHRIKISLISRRIVRTRVSLCGSTWKTLLLLLHIFKERLFILPSSLPIFAVSSWGWWEGDSRRSAFSYNSPLQPTATAWRATQTSENTEMFLVSLQPFLMRGLINRVKK